MNRYVGAAYLAAVVIVAVGVLAVSIARGRATATEQHAVEICFPTNSWGDGAEDRPCDVLQRPAEDGSGYLTLGTLGADAAICTIPNPYEERGRFAIQCRRVPSR